MRTKILALLSLAGAAAVFTAASAASPVSVGHRVGVIAFIRLGPRPGFGGPLYVVRPDGSGLRPVTPSGTTTYLYAWSPDGSLIAYVDQRGSLWLVRPDGMGRRLLLPGSRLRSSALSWSPDGKEIAITSPGPSTTSGGRQDRLYVVPVDDGQPASLHVMADGDVAWSPRGDQIAYSRGGKIFVVRTDGTGSREVAPDDSGEGGDQWSADGIQLAFAILIHRRNGLIRRYAGVGVVDPDGTHFHVVTTHAYTEGQAAAWSPQGLRILYIRADNKGIYVIDPDSSQNHRITRDAPPQAEWPAFAWSPNGGSIVYDSGTYSNTNVYVIGADGRDKVQLTNTPGIYIEPTWATG
jgi:Tol biopolymer transport system component